MNTLTKLVLGMMGQLRAKPAKGHDATSLLLPPHEIHGGLLLMDALALRKSSRDFSPNQLPSLLLPTIQVAAD